MVVVVSCEGNKRRKDEARGRGRGMRRGEVEDQIKQETRLFAFKVSEPRLGRKASSRLVYFPLCFSSSSSRQLGSFLDFS